MLPLCWTCSLGVSEPSTSCRGRTDGSPACHRGIRGAAQRRAKHEGDAGQAGCARPRAWMRKAVSAGGWSWLRPKGQGPGAGQGSAYLAGSGGPRRRARGRAGAAPGRPAGRLGIEPPVLVDSDNPGLNNNKDHGRKRTMWIGEDESLTARLFSPRSTNAAVGRHCALRSTLDPHHAAARHRANSSLGAHRKRRRGRRARLAPPPARAWMRVASRSTGFGSAAEVHLFRK